MPPFMKNPLDSESLSGLAELMARAKISEKDLQETFVRASGPGGQKVNKTSSAVHLKHIPSGREVKVQMHRSQTQNRVEARRMLAEAILAQAQDDAQQIKDRAELKRRQNRPPSRRAKARNTADKRKAGTKKQMRRRPDRQDD